MADSPIEDVRFPPRKYPWTNSLKITLPIFETSEDLTPRKLLLLIINALIAFKTNSHKGFLFFVQPDCFGNRIRQPDPSDGSETKADDTFNNIHPLPTME